MKGKKRCEREKAGRLQKAKGKSSVAKGLALSEESGPGGARGDKKNFGGEDLRGEIQKVLVAPKLWRKKKEQRGAFGRKC